MILLHVSDLRFNKAWFRWLSESSPPHDLLVVTGDLLSPGHPLSCERQAEWVSAWLRAHARPVVLTGGGSSIDPAGLMPSWWTERWLASLARDRVTVPGGLAVEDGVTVYSHPDGAGAGRRADIWAVRTPPAGPCVAWHDTGHGGGDPDLLYLIRRYTPRLVLSGHVPSPLSWLDHFEGVLYLNPGVGDSDRVPNHILVDLDEGVVRLRSVEADDRVTESPVGLGASARDHSRSESGGASPSSEPLLVS